MKFKNTEVHKKVVTFATKHPCIMVAGMFFFIILFVLKLERLPAWIDYCLRRK